MVRHTNINVIYAPLYIHSFCFDYSHASEKAEKFIELYETQGQIHTVSDKLRYYRYEKGLMQKDVADLAGISRSTYLRYEEGGRDSYSLDIIKRIAEVFLFLPQNCWMTIICSSIRDKDDRLKSFAKRKT